MSGKVLDLEVEIVMVSVVLGSTSTTCPFLILIVQAYRDLVQVIYYFSSLYFLLLVGSLIQVSTEDPQHNVHSVGKHTFMHMV
jgi:hypothetical protein